MTAAEAIELAQTEFRKAGLDVRVTAEKGVVRVESCSHVLTSAFNHEGPAPGESRDNFLRHQLIPEAIHTMTRQIADGTATERPKGERE